MYWEKPLKERDPNPMVGSIHKYSDGYGYGARYPTERNRMTLPQSIPQFRLPPPSERFLQGTRSTQIIKKDERSLRRNAEQIVFQTSGEIGQYYYDLPSESSKLMRQPLQRTHNSAPGSESSRGSKPLAAATSIGQEQTLSREPPSSSRQSSARFSDFSAPATVRSGFSTPTSQQQGYSQSDRLLGTLRALSVPNRSHALAAQEDGNAHSKPGRQLPFGFERRVRADLLAATLRDSGGAPRAEAVHSVSGNQRDYMQARTWMLKLRHEP